MHELCILVLTSSNLIFLTDQYFGNKLTFKLVILSESR